MKLTIKWLTRSADKKKRIRERFGIADYETINGWSPADVPDEDLALLKECQTLGLIAVLPFEWEKQGKHYTFRRQGASQP